MNNSQLLKAKKGEHVKVVDIDSTRASRPIIEIKNRITELYDLRRNEVTGTIEVRKFDDKEYTQLNENSLYIQLKSDGYKVTMVDLVALLNSDFVNPYDPLKDYFEHLPNPIPGTIDRFADHILAIQQDQFKHHFKKMLVRAIACALEDRVFNKQCFTLVGREQGTGKTSWCRYLVPPALAEYYTESITHDKDGQIALAQNFLIGLDELSILSRVELNQLKAFFSRDRVSVRHPYARKRTTEPRRASFIASTNDEEFLNDTTGSVRWLCFDIIDINWDYNKISIDHVWAEAYALYKSEFKYELTGEEIRENERRNERFQVVSPEEEYCLKYFSPGNAASNDPFYTTTELKDIIIDKTGFKANLRSVEKLGKALRKLGFEKVGKRVDGKNPKGGYYVKLV